MNTTSAAKTSQEFLNNNRDRKQTPSPIARIPLANLHEENKDDNDDYSKSSMGPYGRQSFFSDGKSS